MTKTSLRATLMLGWACGAATSALSQTDVAQRKSQTPVMQQVAPQSTAAGSIVLPVVGPRDPRDVDRRYRAYVPDAGGPLSGLPYDRDAPVVPATAPIRTLTEAITLAYRTNPELLSSRAQARALDYRIPQARSAYGPTLGITGGYAFTRARQELLPGTFSGAQGWAGTASAILNQPIFTFGRNAASEAGAYATSEYQRDILRLTEAQVLSNVVTAYVAVRRDAASVTIARENLELLNRQLTDNTRRFEVRDLTQTDLDQTRTREAFGRAQLLEAQGRLGASQKQFLQYVGAPPGELDAPDVVNVNFGSIAAAYSYAESNSALIRAAQARERISRAALEAAKAESRPRVDLRGTADYGTVSPYSNELRTTRLVGQAILSQPIIDSGLRRARVGEAREANQSDWRLLDSAMRDTRAAIGSAWDQLAASRASLVDYRAATEAAERAYQGALVQQRAGDRSTLDVLDLARDLLTIRNNYNVALATEYLARASLLAAAGALEAPLVVPGLVGYDADAHFDRVRRKADIPLLTTATSGLDGIVNRDTSTVRPSRDAGAEQALDERLPLPPPPDIR